MDVFSPVCQLYPFSRKGGIASTEALQMDAGTDVRRLKRQASPLVFGIKLGGKKTDVETDFAFVSAKAGHTAFKMKDPWNHAVSDEAVGTGDASRTVFFLDYKFIDSSTLEVFLDSVETEDFTLSSEEGKITFDSAPGSGVVITASYEFYRKFYFEVVNPSKDLEIRKEAPDFWTFDIKLKEALI